MGHPESCVQPCRFREQDRILPCHLGFRQEGHRRERPEGTIAQLSRSALSSEAPGRSRYLPVRATDRGRPLRAASCYCHLLFWYFSFLVCDSSASAPGLQLLVENTSAMAVR